MPHRRRSLSLITIPLAIATTLCLEAFINSAEAQEAQIVPDDTLGAESSQVNSSDPQKTQIDGGATRGENLFHSFKDFSVPTGTEALFNNANSIVNIFSRVTGGNISNIDGLIRANGSANLFLLNPAGIIFGENASLNIGGSFFASTADSLVFDNGFEFGATNPQAPSSLLTVNIPIGLNFRNNPGDIVNSSVANNEGLEVETEETLTLLGGRVSLEGGKVSNGNITLGGLAAAGTVNINDDGSLIFPDNVTQADVFLNSGSSLNISESQGNSIDINASNVIFTEKSHANADTGNDINIQALDTVSLSDNSFINTQVSHNLKGNAGDINIDADNVVLSQGSIIQNQVIENAQGNAGNININTNFLELRAGSKIIGQTKGKGNTDDINIKAGNLILFQDSAIQNQVLENAEGNAGDIIIDTNSLLLRNSQIIADSKGVGNAGKISIIATEQTTLENDLTEFPSLKDPDNINTSRIINDVTDGEATVGDAGNIQIETPILLLQDRSFIFSSTKGTGDAGDININASDRITLTGTSEIYNTVGENAEGNGGDINLITRFLEINDGSVFSYTTGQGDAGNINLNIFEQIIIDGSKTPRSFATTQLNAQVQEGAEGNGGNININANSLEVQNEARILADTNGKGDAGNIEINVDNKALLFNDTSILAQVQENAKGNGGDIKISANSLEVQNEAQILADTNGKGDAGNIEINASDSLSIINEAQLAVDSLGSQEQGNAGNIKITTGSIELDRGKIKAETVSDEGGNITLNIADDLTLRDNSTISAKALQEANGGNIDIDAEFVIAVPNQNNDIIANAQQGAGGNINITTEGIFGIEERSSIPGNQTNDIDASSEFGLSGVVEITQPDVDPRQGLMELPEDVIDPAALIAQNPCTLGVDSEFIITGRGSLPPSPNRVLSSDSARVDWIEPALTEDQKANESTSIQNFPIARTSEERNTAKIRNPVVPARGWVLNEEGEAILVGYDPTNSGLQRSRQNTPTCSAP